MIFEVTPSQTVGPYFAIGVPFAGGHLIVPEGTPAAIRVTGTIYDGRGEVVPDHLIEFWQPDAQGRFADIYGHGEQSTLEGFRGFGRYGVEDGDGT
jgi:protocatechuate 3,4-dioxygenase alpha subunit